MIAWFYSKVLTEAPCTWHWHILTQSNTSECWVFYNVITLETRVLHARADGPVTGHQLSRDTPGHTPPHYVTVSQSPHTSKLSWKLDIKAQCPNVVRSATQSGRIRMASLKPVSGFLLIFLLSYTLPSWELLSYVLKGSHSSSWASQPQYLMSDSFTHSEVRPLMTWSGHSVLHM